MLLASVLAMGTRALAAPDRESAPKPAGGLRLRSIRPLPANLFEPQMAFARDGSTLWLAEAQNGELRLSVRDAEGERVRETTAPKLPIRQPPTGMTATEGGLVVYGDSPVRDGKDSSFAYAQFFDRQGAAGELRVYRGAVGIRAVAGSQDGSVAMLMQVYGEASIHGLSVHGPSPEGQSPPLALLVRVDASGKLLWSRTLDEDHAKRDPWIVGAADGRLALLLGERGLLAGAPGPSWSGGAIAFVSSDGTVTWAGQKLAAISGAAFDARGSLWAVGDATRTGVAPRLLPSSDVPQVLDAYKPELDRLVIGEKGCMRSPQLAVDDSGDVTILAAVTRPCRLDKVDLPADRKGAESWSLLQIKQHRLIAHHVLTTTRARLATSRDGNVAVIATGVRGPTTLDKRTIGKRGETLLIQFER